MTARMKDRQGKIEPVYVVADKRFWLLRLLEKIVVILSTIILWGFIVLTLYHKLFVDINSSLTQVLAVMIVAFAAVVLLLGGWQFYNWFRFHKKARRRAFKQQSLAEVGSLYGISADNMERLQSIRNVAVVEFKNHRYYYCIAGEEPIEIGMLRKK